MGKRQENKRQAGRKAQTSELQLVRRPDNEAVYREAIKRRIPEVVARILAKRGIDETQDLAAFIEAPISTLDRPEALKDVERAALRIAEAIKKEQIIGLECDYDQDGLGALATMTTCLEEVLACPRERIRHYVGHRLRDGYGLSENLAKRIAEDRPRPDILITADNGSSDEERIRALAESGIDVIVTDHHDIPADNPPRSAFAFINPRQEDCRYPDKEIAGGMVAWLLMAVVRMKLVEQGWIEDSPNTVGSVLDYVACSTIADCVSMASMNNRAIVKYGLRLMNKKRRSCWKEMSKNFIRGKAINAEDIAFAIAPRVNAQTRLSSANDAICFLLAKTEEDAAQYLCRLEKMNQERKSIEKQMLQQGKTQAAEQVENGSGSIVVILEDGHPGVQGICSSRLMEKFGRPVFTFCESPSNSSEMTGSGRSPEGVHLRRALQATADRRKGILVKFGGHAAAAGATIKREDARAFKNEFEKAIGDEIGEREMRPRLYSDGELETPEISLETLDQLQALEPTGRGFEQATFDGEFRVQAIREVGDGTHLKLGIEKDGRIFSAIWFRALEEAGDRWPLRVGETARFLYRLADNQGYGARKLDLKILAVVKWKVSESE